MEALSAVIPLSGNSPLSRFNKAVGKMPYRLKGIFPSEMFLFFKLAHDFNADDLILESGVGYGNSTMYLAKLFPSTTIASVDADKYWQLDHVKRQLSAHRNVNVHKGDSTKLLPMILQRVKANRVAVLIDGPKKMLAVSLASRMLQDSRVRFVAVHDLPDEMAKLGSFHSHDSDWRKSYGYLDSKVGEAKDVYPEGPGLTIFKAKNNC